MSWHGWTGHSRAKFIYRRVKSYYSEILLSFVTTRGSANPTCLLAHHWPMWSEYVHRTDPGFWLDLEETRGIQDMRWTQRGAVVRDWPTTRNAATGNQTMVREAATKTPRVLMRDAKPVEAKAEAAQQGCWNCYSLLHSYLECTELRRWLLFSYIFISNFFFSFLCEVNIPYHSLVCLLSFYANYVCVNSLLYHFTGWITDLVAEVPRPFPWTSRTPKKVETGRVIREMIVGLERVVAGRGSWDKTVGAMDLKTWVKLRVSLRGTYACS